MSKQDTINMKLMFSNVDYDYKYLEDLCYEFDIPYEKYYEDEHKYKIAAKPHGADRIFWEQVYDLFIPESELGKFAQYLIERYIDKQKELDLLLKRKDEDG